MPPAVVGNCHHSPEETLAADWAAGCRGCRFGAIAPLGAREFRIGLLVIYATKQALCETGTKKGIEPIVRDCKHQVRFQK